MNAKRSLRIPSRAMRGFTLLEVMVSVLVVAIGLLGLAKMQALSVGSTQLSGGRSLVALQATSLASGMHSARSFWAVYSLVPASCVVTGATVGASCGALSSTTTDCAAAGASCTPTELAAFDLKKWATKMNDQFKTHVTTTTCSGSATTPVACTISIAWTEKTVASVNKADASGAPAATTTQNYVLHVEP